ncbi:MAG: hypothetical protein E6Q76_13505 [Rhizobium sp.]|nr:MAG: hypothetical protein E6Q76_13505 [Rhizobium sp.]
MPTQLNKTAAGRRAAYKPRRQTPMFTREWSIPAILTVLLLGVCALIAYFTWTLMPPATTAQNRAVGPVTLTDTAPKQQP